jgi:hypothetical protein
VIQRQSALISLIGWWHPCIVAANQPTFTALNDLVGIGPGRFAPVPDALLMSLKVVPATNPNAINRAVVGCPAGAVQTASVVVANGRIGLNWRLVRRLTIVIALPLVFCAGTPFAPIAIVG